MTTDYSEYVKIDVLDHGYIRMIDCMGSDLSIVRAARVSYDADWRIGHGISDSDEKLIESMMRRGHTSPFEHVVFTFEVKAPIFVLRQWHRHRTWSYSELSARYAPVKEEYYVPARDQLTTQHATDKQMRSDTPIDGAHEAQAAIEYVSRLGHQSYVGLLRMGVSRELARSVLPVNTYSRMFATVNLHNVMKFLRLRLDEHAQYEIRVYAQAIRSIIGGIVPCAMRAFDATL